MKILKPRHTNISCIVNDGSGLIILEDYYKFPEGKSNLYKVDFNFNLIWESELPQVNDAYSNGIFVENSSVKCGSWNGFECLLDPVTGKIIAKKFTK